MSREVVRIEGAERLAFLLGELSKQAQTSIASKSVRAGSTEVLRAVRKETPVGPTKNLKNAVHRTVRRNSKLPGRPYTANVWVKAPHIFLVHFGTKRRRFPKRKRALSTLHHEGVKQQFVAKYVGPMPANPWIERVWNRLKGKALADSAAKIKSELARITGKPV